MQIAISRALCLAALTLVALGSVLGSVANAQDTVRVRGAIDRVEGLIYVVKSRDGAELKVSLADNGIVVAIVKASLSDIKPGLFVGSTGMPQPDGSQKAIEVHIFPEAMRGTGEGHYPWDLQADSMMTNANVEESVTGVDGQTLTLKYKSGEKKIVVTPQTAIVTYSPGDRNELKPGTKIFIAAAKKQADGTLQAARINYGKDGLTPPM
jgi:outer membrane lipoprotein SlyB